MTQIGIVIGSALTFFTSLFFGSQSGIDAAKIENDAYSTAVVISSVEEAFMEAYDSYMYELKKKDAGNFVVSPKEFVDLILSADIPKEEKSFWEKIAPFTDKEVLNKEIKSDEFAKMLGVSEDITELLYVAYVFDEGSQPGKHTANEAISLLKELGKSNLLDNFIDDSTRSLIDSLSENGFGFLGDIQVDYKDAASLVSEVDSEDARLLFLYLDERAEGFKLTPAETLNYLYKEMNLVGQYIDEPTKEMVQMAYSLMANVFYAEEFTIEEYAVKFDLPLDTLLMAFLNE